MGASLRRLQAAEIDVACGRARWRGQRVPAATEIELLRFEPLALLLPAGHPLGRGGSVPVEALRGLEIDANPAQPDAQEWSDLVIQFLDLAGARPTPDHVSAIGLDDQAHHLVQLGLPILTSVDHATSRAASCARSWSPSRSTAGISPGVPARTRQGSPRSEKRRTRCAMRTVGSSCLRAPGYRSRRLPRSPPDRTANPAVDAFAADLSSQAEVRRLAAAVLNASA